MFRNYIVAVLAEALIEEPEVDAAIAMLQEAVKEFERENENDQKTVAESILAKCIATQRRFADASIIARRLRKIAEKVEDTAARTRVWIELGKVAAASGQVEVARTDLRRALDLSTKYGFALTESDVRLAIAQLSPTDPASLAAIEVIEKDARRRRHGLIARHAGLWMRQSRPTQQ